MEMVEEDIGYYKLLSDTYYLSCTGTCTFRSKCLEALDLLKAGSQDNL